MRTFEQSITREKKAGLVLPSTSVLLRMVDVKPDFLVV